MTKYIRKNTKPERQNITWYSFTCSDDEINLVVVVSLVHVLCENPGTGKTTLAMVQESLLKWPLYISLSSLNIGLCLFFFQLNISSCRGRDTTSNCPTLVKVRKWDIAHHYLHTQKDDLLHIFPSGSGGCLCFGITRLLASRVWHTNIICWAWLSAGHIGWVLHVPSNTPILYGHPLSQ